ncbi:MULTISPECIES: hypothetical protein [Thalassospira]|jgi:uncharacterized membrane protein|uniref:DUF340 domain-containing protein n=1 Tax=Thalassospira indica TaxID=1891279 RepID=A0ABM6XV37_9PROT|nr:MULTISPECIES: hypothetical protein [Thalassospira]MBE70952.1 hypothetical protein [Thalassospira sp.]OAZ14580.1 hypothetical protein TH15_01850 [Thalassospira profundimaris]BDW90462.1 hypothetical protein MACH01_32290 [Thalassospira tepidiphila]AXO13534.1 hypothetical protein DY252_04395 [Thalassospira indica]EKF09114.1 hypothetical protein TH2_04468 [Thalassospira profundimaris WP0211]|tara:strand:- start:523 stop:1011 length:489 start_codon:yes stop_codon:yes gene_type:complete
MSDSVVAKETTRPKIDLVDHAVVLIIVCLVGLVMNTVGPAIPLMDGFMGMIVIYLISMVGLILTRFAPFYLPSVAWISLVGIVATLPWTPGSEWIVAQAKSVNFLALATPALAYAGFAIAKKEIEVAKHSGWKLALVACLVFLGTYAGSVLVAEAILKLQGI